MRHGFDLGDLIRILAECLEYKSNHHLGRPFMSAYQIAILFADAHPGHHLVQTLAVGGEGTGERKSLTQRIARFLSEVAKDPASKVEGGFISHQNVGDFWFDNKGNRVQVSGLDGPGHSIFRLRDGK